MYHGPTIPEIDQNIKLMRMDKTDNIIITILNVILNTYHL